MFSVVAVFGSRMFVLLLNSSLRFLQHCAEGGSGRRASTTKFSASTTLFPKGCVKAGGDGQKRLKIILKFGKLFLKQVASG